MIKRIILITSCMISVSAYAISACPVATDTNTPQFCSTFKTAAICHCTSSGLPQGMCTDIKKIYDRMISMFGSLQRACEYQKDTTTQICIDDWNCYLHGGKDSKGRLCSGTGKPC